MTIPVRVSGQNVLGSPIEEETQTLAISAHGALILVSTQVYRGQRLTLSNVQTKTALECVVAHIDRHKSDHPRVGVEFILPNPVFWHVAFPPKDWTPRHPDAKEHVKNGRIELKSRTHRKSTKTCGRVKISGLLLYRPSSGFSVASTAPGAAACIAHVHP